MLWTLLVYLRCGDSAETPLSLSKDGETSRLTILFLLKSECRADEGTASEAEGQMLTSCITVVFHALKTQLCWKQRCVYILYLD